MADTRVENPESSLDALQNLARQNEFNRQNQEVANRRANANNMPQAVQNRDIDPNTQAPRGVDYDSKTSVGYHMEPLGGKVYKQFELFGEPVFVGKAPVLDGVHQGKGIIGMLQWALTRRSWAWHKAYHKRLNEIAEERIRKEETQPKTGETETGNVSADDTPDNKPEDDPNKGSSVELGHEDSHNSLANEPSAELEQDNVATDDAQVELRAEQEQERDYTHGPVPGNEELDEIFDGEELSDQELQDAIASHKELLASIEKQGTDYAETLEADSMVQFPEDTDIDEVATLAGKFGGRIVSNQDFKEKSGKDNEKDKDDKEQSGQSMFFSDREKQHEFNQEAKRKFGARMITAGQENQKEKKENAKQAVVTVTRMALTGGI